MAQFGDPRNTCAPKLQNKHPAIDILVFRYILRKLNIFYEFLFLSQVGQKFLHWFDNQYLISPTGFEINE